MAIRNIDFKSDSNHVEAVSYDEDSQELFVTFRGGRQYAYQQVNGNEADGVSQADSASKYIDAFIKPSHGFRKL